MERRRWHLTPAVPFLVTALLSLGAVVAACGVDAEGPAERAPSEGAEEVGIKAEDGTPLDARLWARGQDRLVVYLHEYLEDQTSWWPHASGVSESALTIDFRGHGASDGDPNDIDGMVLDIRAAVDFAQSRGYERIMLVGAGMGSAVALVAAVEWPSVTVVGLSTPAEFFILDPVAAAEVLDDRVQLLAARADRSAADSIEIFLSEAGLEAWQVHLYEGPDHGVAMLESADMGEAVRNRLEEFRREFWAEPAPGE